MMMNRGITSIMRGVTVPMRPGVRASSLWSAGKHVPGKSWRLAAFSGANGLNVGARGLSMGTGAMRTQSRPGMDYRRIGATVLGIGATAFMLDAFLNREQRGGLSSFEQQYLNDTFMYVGGAVGLTALFARGMFLNGIARRIMMANPWLVMGTSLVASLGTMYATMSIDPENGLAKHAAWVAFQATQAAVLSPLFFIASPALMARAGLYTVGLIGSLAYVGATAKSDKFLYLGGPLLAGVSIVALSAIAPMFLPLGSRMLVASEAIYLYGGLGVFGMFTLYDVQRILMRARMAEQGRGRVDPCAESISLELDFINIFIRLVQIMAGQQRKR